MPLSENEKKHWLRDAKLFSA